MACEDDLPPQPKAMFADRIKAVHRSLALIEAKGSPNPHSRKAGIKLIEPFAPFKVGAIETKAAGKGRNPTLSLFLKMPLVWG